MAATTTAGGVTSTNSYAADGSRIQRRDGTTNTTLFLPDQEISKSSGGTLSYVRYIHQGGATVAVRTANNTAVISASDIQNTPAININGANTLARRYAAPYGAQISSVNGLLVGQRRFLGRVEDVSGQIADGARTYLPILAIFAAPDAAAMAAPVSATSPYQYGNDSPTNHADPSGFGPADCNVACRSQVATGSEKAKRLSEFYARHKAAQEYIAAWLNAAWPGYTTTELPVPGASKALTGNPGRVDIARIETITGVTTTSIWEVKHVPLVNDGTAQDEALWYLSKLQAAHPNDPSKKFALGEALPEMLWPDPVDASKILVTSSLTKIGVVAYWVRNRNDIDESEALANVRATRQTSSSQQADASGSAPVDSSGSNVSNASDPPASFPGLGVPPIFWAEPIPVFP